MLEDLEQGQGQERRNFVGQDKVLGSQAADLSTAHKLHFAEEDILLAFPAEEASAAGADREVLGVGVPGAREACGCSVALKSEAFAAWGAVDLSDTGKAEFGIVEVEVAPGTVAASVQKGTVPMRLRLEETALAGMSEVGGASLVLGVAEGIVPGHNQVDLQEEGQRTQRKRAAGMHEVAGKAAAVMLVTLGEAQVESVPRKKMGGSFEAGGVVKAWR